MSIDQVEAISPAVARAKLWVEERLDRYTQLDSGCPARLREAIRYSLLAPAKRLRPTLVLTASSACGGDVEAALPAACAVEMIHTYSLIHDDLPAMDDDDLRRGRPTCHKRFDEATAILAGDALIPLAFEVLARDSRSPEIAAESCRVLAMAAGASQLVGGQVDDLAAALEMRPDIDWLRSIHVRKTAALIACSLRLGAISAGASAADQQGLADFGLRLGLTFQIVDDLLDLQGDPVKMGKAARKDAARGKLTYPGLVGIDESRRQAEKLIAEAIAGLKAFGGHPEGLVELARFVLGRSN